MPYELKNMTVNLSMWQYKRLPKKGKSQEIRYVIHNFLEKMRKIDFIDGRKLLTAYFTPEDLDYARKLKKKRIIFSFSELARIALFFDHLVKKPHLNYLEENNIIILREA